MQSYTEIPSTQSLQSSLSLLLNNDKTALSSNSGTAFPTTNLQVGMFCLRTDQGKLYQLKDAIPTWVMVADLTKTPAFLSDLIASAITNTPAGNLAATTVQAALNELQSDVDSKASSASPALTGTPTAPTAAPGTNTTQIASTAFVAASVATAQPIDATLTALAGLVTGADQLPYSTGADVFAQTPLTAFSRTLLDDTNASAAQTTLAIASTKRAFTAQQTAMNGALTDAVAIDWNGDVNGQVVAVTLAGNRTMNAPTNIVQYTSYLFRVTQDATGSRTLVWNAAFKFGGAGAPVLTTTAAKTDILSFIGGAGNTLEYLGIRKDAV